MDEYNGKKAGKGPSFSGRGSSISFRDPIQDGRNIQYCNRLGCSTRLNSMKGTQVSTPEKPKYPKASFRSTSSKAMAAGSSSKSLSASTNLRKSYQERRNQYPFRETAESSSRQRVIEDSDSSSQHEGTENSEFSLTTSEIHSIDEVESPIIQGSTSTSTESSGSRPQKQINRRLASNSQDTASSSSFRRSISSRSIVQAPRLASQSLGTGSQRYGLKNLSCTSISDVLPSGCSSSDSSQSRRVVSVRKRPSDEESSSGGRVAAGVSSSSLSGLRGSQMPQQASRRARNRPVSRDGPVSVRTRRPSSGETRMRLPEQVDDNVASISEPIIYPQLPHTQLPIPDAASTSSSRSFPIDPPPVFHSPFGRSNVSSRSARSRLGSRPEDGGPQIFHGPLGDRDGYRRFNMEGIAEVLLALERIEQDEELTYEQLLVLETNLFLGGLSFHDQHRDMRLDIDNMTYEELLALEEKMGNVSTALSDEALSKCLKRSMYSPASQIPGIAARGDDDIKCSVCQEEYVLGDEVGKLACGHRYHVLCIHQWLRQKNWCPICKASAASPC